MATVSDRTAAGQGWGGWAGAWVCTAGRGGTLLPGCAPPLHAALWCFFFFFGRGGSRRAARCSGGAASGAQPIRCALRCKEGRARGARRQALRQAGAAPVPTSGTSSQLHALAVRSHTRMLPCWSPAGRKVRGLGWGGVALGWAGRVGLGDALRG